MIDNKYILVVDDEKICRDMMSSFLIQLIGSENNIITVSSGNEAISILNESKIEIVSIFLDMKMNDGDGLSVLRFISNNELSHVPIYIVSSVESNFAKYIISSISQLDIRIEAFINKQAPDLMFEKLKRYSLFLESLLSIKSSNVNGAISSCKEISESEILSLIKEDCLSIYLQPKINLKSDFISGFEILTRLIHDEYGVIAPGVFMPKIKDFNIIKMFNWQVFEKTFLFVKQLNNKGAFFNLSINVDVDILSDNDFIDRIVMINNKIGIDLSYLTIEVSKIETIHDGRLNNNLLKMKLLGISISFNNFGTNITNLNCLNDFHFDEIKIDKEFVSNALVSEESKITLLKLINLIKINKINVVAKGVENYDLTRFLMRHDCDEAQGYYYYMPRPISELPAIYIEKFKSRTSKILGMISYEKSYLMYDSFYENIVNQIYLLKEVDINEKNKISYMVHKIKGGLISSAFSEGLVFLEKFNKSGDSKYLDDMLKFINYSMVLYGLRT